MMRDIDDTAKADALLMEHYFWQKSWKPRIGYGTCAPECRQAKSNMVMDSAVEVIDQQIQHLEMEAVDWCMDAISSTDRQAIGAEMVNRDRNIKAKASVWRPNTERTYTEAVAVIIPFMRKKNLV